MKSGTGKIMIGINEAISLLTVSRIFYTITYSVSSRSNIGGTAAMIAFAIGVLMDFVIILPYIWLLNRYPRSSIVEVTHQLFGNFSWIIAIIFFILLIVTSANTLSGFERFLNTEIFPQSSPWIVLILLASAIFYGATMGMEALGRFANLVLIVSAVSIVFIFLSLLPDFRLTNFEPPLEQGWGILFERAFQNLNYNTELLTVLLIVPVVRGKHGKGFAIWNLLSLILIEIISATIAGVLGSFAATQEYPYYTAATIAGLSIFQRLDAIHMGIWVLITFVKSAYYLVLAKNMLDVFLPHSARKYSLRVSAALLFVLSVLFSFRPQLLQSLKTILASGYLTWGLLVILPLLLIVFSMIKGRKKKNAS